MIFAAIAATLIAVVVAFVLISNMQSKRKKEAIADLDRERESLKTLDMLELVNEEVEETGIGNLPGATGIDQTVLLKVWKRDRGDCAEGQGSFVVEDGTVPEEATADTLRFECGDDPSA